MRPHHGALPVDKVIQQCLSLLSRLSPRGHWQHPRHCRLPRAVQRKRRHRQSLCVIYRAANRRARGSPNPNPTQVVATCFSSRRRCRAVRMRVLFGRSASIAFWVDYGLRKLVTDRRVWVMSSERGVLIIHDHIDDSRLTSTSAAARSHFYLAWAAEFNSAPDSARTLRGCGARCWMSCGRGYLAVR